MYVFKLGNDFYWKGRTVSNVSGFDSVITTNLDDATFFGGYTPNELKEKYDWLIQNGFKLIKIVEEEV